MNIVLLGFMGTGKSAVAQVLSRRLNLHWLDMDHEIETRQGCSIEDVFRLHGEPFFRSLEREIVKELVKKEGWVVSTGGGVVLEPKNIEDFENWGLCICLSAKPKAIYERTHASRHSCDPKFHRQRPLLKSSDPMQKIQELLESRKSFYESIPNQIDTTEKSIHDVVETILLLVKDYELLNGGRIEGSK